MNPFKDWTPEMAGGHNARVKANYGSFKAKLAGTTITTPPDQTNPVAVTQGVNKCLYCGYFNGYHQPGCASLIKPKKRIRQSSKPPTKLETDGLAWLRAKYNDPSIRWHTQAWRVRIANGAWYKVDICAEIPSEDDIYETGQCWHAWETKCLKGKNAARGILALKCAASAFPEVVWHLLTKENGQFQDQIILP